MCHSRINFPWLVRERGGGDYALIQIIKYGGETLDQMKVTKLLLQRAQATPGLIDVGELLAEAARGRWRWPDMCRMLILDGHADARAVVKISSSGRLEFKEHIKKRPFCYPWFLKCDEKKLLDAIAACLPDEMLQAMMTEARETGSE